MQRSGVSRPGRGEPRASNRARRPAPLRSGPPPAEPNLTRPRRRGPGPSIWRAPSRRPRPQAPPRLSAACPRPFARPPRTESRRARRVPGAGCTRRLGCPDGPGRESDAEERRGSSGSTKRWREGSRPIGPPRGDRSKRALPRPPATAPASAAGWFLERRSRPRRR